MQGEPSRAARPPRWIRRDTWARPLGLVYGVTAFAGTWIFFAWFVVFLGNFPKRSSPWLETTVDTGATVEPLTATLVNFVLISLFCLQHSLMARPWFKRMLARSIPPALERATYVHAANLAGMLFLFFWQPIPIPLWTFDSDLLEGLIWCAFGAGWLILLSAALSMNIWELLGLRQAWSWFRRRPHAPLMLKTSWLYRYLEHPMYVGVALGIWMTPHMTVGHALLASLLTLYIAIGMSYERRDLQARFGASYRRWRADRDGAPVGVCVHSAVANELKRRLDHITREPLPARMAALLYKI